MTTTLEFLQKILTQHLDGQVGKYVHNCSDQNLDSKSHWVAVYLHLTLLASGNFFCLLKTFANSLNPDQDQQNVGPDLDSNCLTL